MFNQRRLVRVPNSAKSVLVKRDDLSATYTIFFKALPKFSIVLYSFDSYETIKASWDLAKFKENLRVNIPCETCLDAKNIPEPTCVSRYKAYGAFFDDNTLFNKDCVKSERTLDNFSDLFLPLLEENYDFFEARVVASEWEDFLKKRFEKECFGIINKFRLYKKVSSQRPPQSWQ